MSKRNTEIGVRGPFSNPFAVQSPEDVKAKDAYQLFVNVFTDFPRVESPGHTFLHGPRGSGKSMMFRYLQPDCQVLDKEVSIHDLPFFAVYVPVKETSLKLTELLLMKDQYAEPILNEHFMVLHVLICLFESLLTQTSIPSQANTSGIKSFYYDTLERLLKRAGLQEMLPRLAPKARSSDYIIQAKRICDDLYDSVITYLRKIGLSQSWVPFEGPITSYLEFLFPLLQEVRKLPFMPSGPLYVLIDDADNLSENQTRVLNSWVSSRRGTEVSLKISTQLDYKTYRTLTNQTISAPHDYSEVNIASVYTSSKNKYRERIDAIVQKRLQSIGLNSDPRKFFPPDQKQEAAIRAIGEAIKNEFPTKGRGYRANDDVTRYARPTYIASLKEPSKKTSTGSRKLGSKYSYSGFEQLVHISSGVVRYFLEAASLMYSEELSLDPSKPVDFIRPSVQNTVVRQLANDFRFLDFEKMRRDRSHQPQDIRDLEKLRNLVDALGGMFHIILLSNSSERRVFSVAISDEPDDEILRVFRLGVRNGYFHESSIGNKDGTGRTSLFILSRRLAPLYLLDPTSFAGYKFVTSAVLREAMLKPDKLLKAIETKGLDAKLEDPQKDLFIDSE
jgi:hypothetical protein